MNIGIAILRIAVGVIFVVHGWQKLFIFGHSGVTGAFTQMGVPMPELSGIVVTAVEILGGTALILGAFTRIAALLLAIDMLGAILLVHRKGGFFLPNGAEYAFALLAATVALALIGSGALAVDATFANRRVR